MREMVRKTRIGGRGRLYVYYGLDLIKRVESGPGKCLACGSKQIRRARLRCGVRGEGVWSCSDCESLMKLLRGRLHWRWETIRKSVRKTRPVLM